MPEQRWGSGIRGISIPHSSTTTIPGPSRGGSGSVGTSQTKGGSVGTSQSEGGSVKTYRSDGGPNIGVGKVPMSAGQLPYDYMEGVDMKKRTKDGWEYGRVFKAWVPPPQVKGFKSDGATIAVWVPDDETYNAVKVTRPIVYRGTLNGRQVEARLKSNRQVTFYPPYNPAQKPNKDRTTQIRGVKAQEDFWNRFDFGGPVTEADLDFDGNHRSSGTGSRTGDVPPGTHSDGKGGFWFKMAFPEYQWPYKSADGRSQTVTARPEPCMVHVKSTDPQTLGRPHFVTPRHTHAMVKDASGTEHKVVLPNKVFKFNPPGHQSGQGAQMNSQGYYVADHHKGGH